MCIVYKVTSPSGKIYIGQTQQAFEKRKKDHKVDAEFELSKSKGVSPFHNAILKYRDTLQWEILKENLSNEEASFWEEYYIEHFGSLIPDGYNATTGGKQNWSHSAETRQRISEKATQINIESWKDEQRHVAAATTTKDSWTDPTIRDKRTAAVRAVRGSDEQRALTSEDNKRRYADPAARIKMAEACGAKTFEVFDKEGNSVGIWSSYAQCAKDLKFKTKDHIGRCVRGLTKSYCGYTFKEVNPSTEQDNK